MDIVMISLFLKNKPLLSRFGKKGQTAAKGSGSLSDRITAVTVCHH